MSPSPSRQRLDRRRLTGRSGRLLLAILAVLGVLGVIASGASRAASPPVLIPEEVREAAEAFVLVTVANPRVSRPAAVGGTAHGYGAQGRYRIGPTAAATISALEKQYALRRVSEWPIEPLDVHCVLFRIPAGTTREAVLQRLRADPRVRIAQALNEFAPATSDAAGYDDPYARLQSNVRALGMASAHRISRGLGIRVAVIDTGVDVRHPDLAGRRVITRNFVDTNEAAFRADRHGTQVAGLIAAAPNNGIGIVGVAPDVQLLAFKACWQTAASAPGRCNSFTLAQAVAEALTLRAQVINLSLVGPADPLLEALLGKAIVLGVAVVGAASEDLRLVFPARVPGVLAVGEAESPATDRSWLRAPARDIVSLVPDGHYDFASGSSLATAQVSGVVALLLARDGRLSEARLRELLAASTARHDTAQGAYLSVNACAALARLVPGARCD